VDIEFDARKDEANKAKHGLSLADAVELDLASAAVVPDDRNAYGETRYRAFGRIDGLGYCLVFSHRAEKVRVISFRRCHEREMARYDR
jgi:hypothetical protein